MGSSFALPAGNGHTQGSVATFDTYRKESERLLLWSITELRKPRSFLTHKDLLVYRRLLADPQPAQRWVMTGRKVARADLSWRPFAGPLTPSSERQAFVILNTLFARLVNAGYLAGNPRRCRASGRARPGHE